MHELNAVSPIDYEMHGWDCECGSENMGMGIIVNGRGEAGHVTALCRG